jgi:uncharacterized protein (TIGR03435 family)
MTNTPVLGVIGMVAALLGGAVLGAAQPQEGPRFEVASVKPNHTDAQPFGLVGGDPGGVRFTNIQLRDLIRRAYRLQEHQLLGGPNWIRADRFDVVAKTTGPASVNAKWSMMRALLAERFKLRVHTENRNLLVYHLLRARKDGKLGPRLTRSSLPCVEGQAQPCAVMGISRSGELSARVDTMDDFIRRGLMFILGVTVIDGTGLQGNFDIDLKWIPESPTPPLDGRTGDAESDASIFTAIREQLGLKLEPRRGAVEVLVIDSVEHPTVD